MELSTTAGVLSTGTSSPEMSTPGIISILTPIQRVILTSIMIFICIVGVLGNIIVISAVILSKKLRCVTNIFVVSLAVADLMTCLNIPWMAVATLSEAGWILPDWICTACGFVLMVCIGSSIYTLACVATIRSVVITGLPGRCRTLYTPPKICAILILIWTVPLAVATIPLVSNFGKLGYDFKYSSCTWDTSNPNSGNFSKLISGVFYPLPFIIITYSYFKIYRHVRRHSRAVAPILSISSSVAVRPSENRPNATGENIAMNPNNNSRDHRTGNSFRERLNKRQVDVTKNMFYIVCAFVLCISPFGFCLMYDASDPFVPYAGMFLFGNSCINPFIYATKHPDFKKVIRLMLTCKFSKI
ncbi:octopamine receptor 1-like [Patiria miniata]|uniref:G-protein coupled receptors family 1 profile domain-containing protein n=1 Tax=Patiria miniata TaxID=46514 RepID=A0A914A049_PATMI|nr:octopamine receptor 1-like [Patiria miniata]